MGTIASEQTLRAFDAAFRAPNPTIALRDVVAEELVQHDRATVLDELEELRAALRAASRDAEEDVVLEVMDFVTGWCAPHVRL